jgi:hypothetical protein
VPSDGWGPVPWDPRRSQDAALTPHWECGYRVHGFWITTSVRIGWVGLPPRPYRASQEGYGWAYDPQGVPRRFHREGHSPTLRAAKQAVERAYRAHLEGTPS